MTAGEFANHGHLVCPMIRFDSTLEFPAGMVWLVGAGPGDPGLLTLHAANALARAEVVVHDSLVRPAVFDHCPAESVRIHSGNRGGRPSPQQTDISARLVALAREGKRVVRLKGGDPFIFGRGSEEVLALIRSGVPVRVTPGVSAGYGGLAYAGLPLTSRETNQCVTFLTGHDQFGTTPAAIDWRMIANGSQVIVMYMAMKHLATLVENLMTHGRSGDETLAIACNLTFPDQTVLLTTLEKAVSATVRHDLKAPAVICVGANVHMVREIHNGFHDSIGTLTIDAESSLPRHE